MQGVGSFDTDDMRTPEDETPVWPDSAANDGTRYLNQILWVKAPQECDSNNFIDCGVQWYQLLSMTSVSPMLARHYRLPQWHKG